MQNLNFKRLFYIILLFVSYYLGEKDFINLSLEKLNLSVLTKESIIKTKSDQQSMDSYTVSYVVDGDTIHVKDKNGKEDIVRFLAVNTLEKNATSTREKCFANMQAEFTKLNLLNKQVYLIVDETQPVRDKYNRLLAYVSTTSLITNYYFNDLLIQTGNAKIYKANPKAKKYDEFEIYQSIAKEKKLGMWNTLLCN